MKNLYFLLLLVSTSIFSQNFEEKWDKVMSLEKELKIKSANNSVDEIYKNAVFTKNEVQIIKCFFYKSKYMLVLEEDSHSKIITQLNSEIPKFSDSSKAILYFIKAKCLSNYLNDNRYRINDRTKTDEENEDFKTWSIKDFEDNIEKYLAKSLENEDVLKKTMLSNYEQLFDYTDNTKFSKQNLYDYLIQENITFYKSKINTYESFDQFFSKTKESMIGKSEAFIELNFENVKNKYLKRILELFQKTEIINSNNENLFNRLQFCNQYIFKNNEDYLNQIKNLSYKNDTLFNQKVMFEKANLYSLLANKKTFLDYNKLAIKTLDSIISIKNHSNNYKSALQKKQYIEKRVLNVEMQKYIYNNENHRAFVRYRNCNRLQISFYKIDIETLEELNNPLNSIAEIYECITETEIPIAKKEYNLKNNHDYFEYTTELLLPNLETGNYLVRFESDAFDNDLEALEFQTLCVSNISVLETQNNNKKTYQILDRKTSLPLKNVKISSSLFELKTNSLGLAEFNINNTLKPKSQRIMFTKDSDSLLLYNSNLYYYPYEKTSAKKSLVKTEFFLDRAIYRPGQTVYYKGITTQKSDNKTKVVPFLKQKITIKDANFNNIKEFEVTSNEFGSFYGEFILPKNGLTGNFSLYADIDRTEIGSGITNTNDELFWKDVEFQYSYKNFQVEEYKRPRFEVKIDDFKKDYQVNQKIEVTGFVKAFSGSNISNAEIKFIIERHTKYSKKEKYYSNYEEILSGETKTDEKGNFIIDFTAIPDEDDDRKDLPIYSYSIEIDVTDINGETHSQKSEINVGYHNLNLDSYLPYQIESKNSNNLVIISQNLNHQKKETSVDVSIYFENEIEQKFKKRIFQKPEIETISKENFENLFPFEKSIFENYNHNRFYNEERIIEKILEKDSLVFFKNINTKIENNLPLNFISNYKSGKYRIVLKSIDVFGNKIESKREFELKNNFQEDKSKLFSIEQVNLDAKKDGFVAIKITSLIQELHLIGKANYNGTDFFEQDFELKNKIINFNIPIPENYEDSITIGFETFFENQSFNSQIEVPLIVVQPKSTIEVETFRNKIEPGSKENWSFKLKSDSQLFENEVLATMYDSSLDQFSKDNWNLLQFKNSKYNRIQYKLNYSIGNSYSSLQNLNPATYSFVPKTENTSLMWFGFYFMNSEHGFIQTEYQKQVERKTKKPLNSRLIYGCVRDNDGTVASVNIVVKGTNRNTQTDIYGNFDIDVAFGETLEFSIVGYNTFQLKITTTENNIQLKRNSNTLDEIVVTGMGIKKSKKAMGYAVTKREEIVFSKGDDIAKCLSGASSGIAIESNGDKENIIIRGINSLNGKKLPLYIIDGTISSDETLKKLNSEDILSVNILKGNEATALYGSQAANGVIIVTTKKAIEELSQVKARKNLSETAFFYPNLKTDADGKINFSFTSPEALTSWRFRMFAHNKDAVSTYLEKSVVTQKDLMLTPNFPRFLREKDSIVITAKIANITSEAKTGVVLLQLFDASNGEKIDSKTLNSNAIKNFTIPAFGNTNASWKIFIPEGLQGVQYKIVAKSGDFSDGEENILPVLTNSILVTESIPIWVRENSKKVYSFENLKNNVSTTLRNHQFILEYTSNPTWLAIQSLPYLMEFEHECAEQTFARFYANILATEIINSNPKIASVFENWKKNNKLKSNLEENEELKSMIIAETPWLNDAKSEDEKKQKLALLFDLEKMKNSQEIIFEKLKQLQKPSGGFCWFGGDYESEYITRHILSGFGHLKKLNIKSQSNDKIAEMTKLGVSFMDNKFVENNKYLLKVNKKIQNPYSDLHYLYTRSFYLEQNKMSSEVNKIIAIFIENIKTNWMNYSLYEKALAALTLHRFNEIETAKKIVVSLKETASNNEDWGMYWIENKQGYNWNEAPIETQSLLIEAFSEINNDTKSVDAMKVWLLKNKQTKNWPTTKSTTEAIYALLMQGTDWLSVKDNTVFKIGNEKILSKKLSDSDKEAETGYVKLTWKKEDIKNEMSKIEIENKSKVPGFGGAYWQYFEDSDKIKSNSKTNLSVSKELFLKVTTAKGTELQKINSNTILKIGDLVTSRIVINATENMEFIHLKDMRASCFEPIDVISKYEYQDDLGFYKSTKDTSTHFFFDKIDNGTYFLEYDIRVNNSGDFSNGITTIQSMYAPEYSSHTKGIRVKIK